MAFSLKLPGFSGGRLAIFFACVMAWRGQTMTMREMPTPEIGPWAKALGVEGTTP